MQRMDGLRGVLAVYVMLGHALPFTSLPPWLTQPFSHGEAAVKLFFVLSGLVLVNSLDRFGGKFWPFMQARGRRLLPVYFLVLAASIAVVAAGDPLTTMPWVGQAGQNIWEPNLPPHLAWHIAAHAVLAQGIIPQGLLPYAYVTLLGPAWSLSTEWQFYLLVGLCAPRRLAGFALGLLALGIAYHFCHLPPEWQFSRAFLPDAAPFFALGLASAVWLRGGGLLAFTLCLAGACALESLSGPGKALVPLVWAAAMLAQHHKFGALLASRPALYLGAISYPLYLVNEPVGRGLALLLAPTATHPARFTTLWLPLTLAASLAAAAALHHGVEQPFMRQRKKLLLPVIAPAVLE
jgi:peptidoglycan/LPS O-acetylase OafA/YrhL